MLCGEGEFAAQLSACARAAFDREEFFVLFGVPIVSANSSRNPTRNDDTDGELGNAACPSIAAEDLLSLLE